MKCTECGAEDPVVHVVNDGIGPYEYWGQKCNQVIKVLRSKCCDATVENSFGDILTPEDLE